MTTISSIASIANISPELVLKATAIEVGGTIFARAEIYRDEKNLVTVDKLPDPSFNEAQAAAVEDAIAVVNRFAAPHDEQKSETKLSTQAKPAAPSQPAPAAAAPTMQVEKAAEQAPAPIAEGPVAEAHEVAEDAVPAEDTAPTTAEETTQAEEPAPAESAAPDEKEAATDSENAEPENASADKAEANDEGLELEDAYGTVLTLKDGVQNAALKDFVGQELRILAMQKPSMLRLLARRPELVTEDCLRAINLIAKH